MRKQKFRLPVKLIVSLAIIFLAFFLLMVYIWKALTTSDFFTVRRVVVRNSDASFDYLKGRNIFTLDLKGQEFKARMNCPDCRKVRFARVFPDSVFVDFLKREPIAVVKLRRDFVIDGQGVLFYPSGTGTENGLPVIYGLGRKILKPVSGTKYNLPELNTALDIIKDFAANRNLRGFTLMRVDVSDPESAFFFMLLPRQEQGGFEVRTGENNIRAKMMILGGLVRQASAERTNIKYIDLRFKEPVIKFKDAFQ